LSWWHAILLGILQGATEFLPISSSGHLVLAQHYLGFPEESGAAALFFDGMLHLGTVVAVLAYFGREALPSPAQETSPSRAWLHLFFLVVLASLPAVVVALLASDHIKSSFTNPLMVACSFLVLGFILLLSDQLRCGQSDAASTRWWQALLIGCGQACSALFRGLSRSGMTITSALAVGLQRDWAVRFSFLMSIVASLGLGGLGLVKALIDPSRDQWLTAEFVVLTLLGTAVSAVVGYLSIAPLIRLVRATRLWWFSVYLWVVGVTVLVAQLLG
jgi:undecaprenyl-diphosphatase